MAVIKIACPKCGQKVSGDDTFYGRSVNCPICTSKIVFPDNPTGGPDLDALSSGASQPAPPPAAPPGPAAFETTPPASQTPAEPTFETIHPTNQQGPMPTSQPSFETVPPANQEFPPGPSFDSAPPSNPSSPYNESPPPGPAPAPASDAGILPPVPQPPETPPADENDDVPSPLLGSVSLVVGILNTVTLCVGGILLAPISIILGHAALAKAKNSPVKPAPGQSLAMIGVILGYAGLASTILGLIIMLVFKEPLTEMLRPAEGAQ